MKTNWYTQSIHETLNEHRTIRRRRAMHAQLEAIYGPTIRYGPPEPLPPGLATELRLQSEARNLGNRARARIREARNAFRYARLLAAQDNRCYICTEAFTDENPPTKDHVWPRARGGRDGRNILWACVPCNGSKSDSVPTEEQMARLRELNVWLDENPKPASHPAEPIPLAYKRKLGLVVRR